MNSQKIAVAKLALAIGAVLLSSPGWSQSSAASNDAIVLDTVNTTANFLAETSDQTLAAVSIITRSDIERTQALDLLDLMRTQVGVDVNRTGGFGQTATFFLRGSNSNHVLVLIDGVRVASSNSGLFDFAHLPLELVERIEIVRGPRAAIWGSDAIGGVIQIFTRRDANGVAALRAGSDRYGQMSAGVGGGERWRWRAQAGFTRSAGISAQNEDGFGFDPDRDGYRNRHAKLYLGTALGNHQLDVDVAGSNNHIEFDQGRSQVKWMGTGVHLQGDLTDRWWHRLSAGAAYENIFTPAFFSRFTTRRQNLDWVDRYRFNDDHIISTGYSYQHERGRTDDLFEGVAQYDASRVNQALFARYRGAWATVDAEIVARWDDNSAFGNAFTPQVAMGWDFAPQWRAILSYGEGFRAPNLNELYSPGFDGLFAGNPALQAESSRALEAGVERQWSDAGHWSLRYSRNRVTDLISFSGGETFRAENIDQARIRSLESEAAFKAWDWDWRLGVTWQNAENAVDGSPLLRRPDWKAQVQADRQWGKTWSLGWQFEHVSSRADFGGELEAYALASVRSTWQWRSGWTLEARLDNLFDEDYTLATGFNTPGRTAQLGVRHQW